MQYGYFDDQNYEYVITDPNTPSAWSNYMGDPAYGGIISNNAGGFSFVKSGGEGRIIRYLFNATVDAPGRYVYLRDADSGKCWSASWAPMCVDLDNAEYECRHGMGYTRITSKYEGIDTQCDYFIPIGQTHDVWMVTVRNDSEVPRHLNLFPFVEFTNDNNELQDAVNLQYTRYIAKTYNRGNLMVQVINEAQSEKGATFSSQGTGNEGGEGIYRFFGLAGAQISGFDGDRESFIGFNRGYHNPQVVQEGRCRNSLSYGGNSVGVFQVDPCLAPGERISFVVVLGAGNEADASRILANYTSFSRAEEELRFLRQYWQRRLSRLQVVTPDIMFNRFVNFWNAYQCFITFTWSRSASLEYRGLRNGFGYRDTVQDIQGIVHLDPVAARKRLVFMLSGQTSEGGGLPLVPFDLTPGQEPVPGSEAYARRGGHSAYRCDDTLWLFRTVPDYVKESGEWGFFDEVIPFSDNGETTVYGHLKRALQFSEKRKGVHGLLLGLDADWCDGLRLGEGGESVFASLQYLLGLVEFERIATLRDERADAEWARSEAQAITHALETHAFEEDQLIRGIKADGERIGSKDAPEGNFWLNPQSWAVLSGFAHQERGLDLMDRVYERLSTPFGIQLLTPFFKKMGLPVIRIILALPGTKENAAIFNHTQGWAIEAETRLGRGNRAMEYYRNACPGSMNDRAEVRVNEPYVHNQFTHGSDSPFHGRTQCSWLSGTASSMQVAAVRGILGIRPDYEGILLDPCIPSDWTSLEIEKHFRGKVLRIRIENPDGNQKGVRELQLNGKTFRGNFISFDHLGNDNRIVIKL